MHRIHLILDNHVADYSRPLSVRDDISGLAHPTRAWSASRLSLPLFCIVRRLA